MTDSDRLLERAQTLFPAPEGALDRVRHRQERLQRRRRVGVVVAVAVLWLVIGLVVLLRPSTDSAPAGTPTPATTPAPAIAGVPASFPPGLPLPDDARVVGSASGADDVEVWFRTERDPDELRAFFEREMPGAGWPGRFGAPIYGGHWDYFSRTEKQEVNIVVRTEPGPNPGSFTGGHGAYDLDAPWDIYVHVRDLRREAQPTSSVTVASPPIPQNVVESDQLPASFPPEMPLPSDAIPVAHYESDGMVAVWFASDLDGPGLRRFFEEALPSRGWSDTGGTSFGDIWDQHVAREGRDAFVFLREAPDADRLLHGSDAYDGGWSVYILVHAP